MVRTPLASQAAKYSWRRVPMLPLLLGPSSGMLNSITSYPSSESQPGVLSQLYQHSACHLAVRRGSPGSGARTHNGSAAFTFVVTFGTHSWPCPL